MRRSVQLLTFAAVIVGGAGVLCEPVRANPTCQAGLTCPGVASPDPVRPLGQARVVRRKHLFREAFLAEARVLNFEPEAAGPGRVVSLLILGVGY